MTIPQPPDRTIAAAGLIVSYAVIIGFTDNFVLGISEEVGLWQLHLTRSVLAMALLIALAPLMGLKLWPRSWGGVTARSALHGVGIMIYFGALGFLPVAVVAAGLFTAPIFVLLISGLVYRQRIGPYRIAAVAIGFLGVILVLGPLAQEGESLAALLPVAAGALYAMGNIATRQWCANETAETLLAGFFVGLGVLGAIGMAVLTFLPVEVPAGPLGYLLRGAVWPSGNAFFWITVQAVGSLIGVGLAIRAYQIADAGRVSVLEYTILPASAFWTWLLWGEVLGGVAWIGMALIAAAGILIAMRARAEEARP